MAASTRLKGTPTAEAHQENISQFVEKRLLNFALIYDLQPRACPWVECSTAEI